MIIERTTYLACSPEKCFLEVSSSRLLEFVSWPMVRFDPIDPPRLPRVWEEKHYLVKVSVFGFIPFGRQHINITGRNRSGETGSFFVEVRDNGHGSFISTWDHFISIRETGAGCRYSDRVEIKAGLLTPLVVVFAWFFYRHRQRRWQRLVSTDFTYA